MTSKAMSIGAGVMVALALSGCSSKNDPTERNFAAVLTQYLDNTGDLCLGVGTFPVDIAEADVRAIAAAPTGMAARMAALQQAGLVSGVDISLGQLGVANDRLTGRRIGVRRYELTTAGRDAYRKIVADQAAATGKTQPERGDICYGKVGLDTVKDWDGPTHVNGQREVAVNYTYTVSGVAAWAKTPQIGQAFPFVANILAGAGQQTLATTLVSTDKGWAAKSP